MRRIENIDVIIKAYMSMSCTLVQQLCALFSIVFKSFILTLLIAQTRRHLYEPPIKLGGRSGFWKALNGGKGRETKQLIVQHRCCFSLKTMLSAFHP